MKPARQQDIMRVHGYVECKIIPFPRKETKKEVSIPSMECRKTQMIDWDFSRGL
jgi:hypothetical protein